MCLKSSTNVVWNRLSASNILLLSEKRLIFYLLIYIDLVDIFDILYSFFLLWNFFLLLFVYSSFEIIPFYSFSLSSFHISGARRKVVQIPLRLLMLERSAICITHFTALKEVSLFEKPNKPRRRYFFISFSKIQIYSHSFHLCFSQQESHLNSQIETINTNLIPSLRSQLLKSSSKIMKSRFRLLSQSSRIRTGSPKKNKSKSFMLNIRKMIIIN